MKTRKAAGQLGADLIACLIGNGSINHTIRRWNVRGTDLGHMFLHKDKMWLAFGDTLGAPTAANFWSVPHKDWRSNTMAWVSPDQDPGHGLRFGGMISDRPGHAKQLLPALHKPGVEQTVIPTYGTSDGDRMYLHYMSVRKFDDSEHWRLNYSGIAYSDDDGHTWSQPEESRWPGHSTFGQVAFVEHADYLYVFGIPGGRLGSVRLARVKPSRILDLGSYAYWDGRSWQADIARAATVVPAPSGELSVRWNSHYQRWLMMNMDEPVGQILVRTARDLTGPWSRPAVVTTSEQYSRPYAPYITPLWNDGPDIYFTMTMWKPYAVYLMRTSLA